MSKKNHTGVNDDRLLIIRLSRLNNHVAIVMDWLAFADIGFEGDSSD